VQALDPRLIRPDEQWMFSQGAYWLGGMESVVLSRVRHKRLVEFYGASSHTPRFEQQPWMALVMELCHGGSLKVRSACRCLLTLAPLWRSLRWQC
jgi:serine/threonine protein kinase